MPPRSQVAADNLPRVVITGIGLWTPLGSGRELTWQSLIAGRSASRWLTVPQWTGTSPVAGAACEIPPATINDDVDPVIAMARQVSIEAIADAGLGSHVLAQDSTGVVFGTSKGGLHTASRLLAAPSDANGNAGSWLDVWPNSAAVGVARDIGCLGPVLAPVAACATGLAACLRGYELIRDGRCQVVVAGSSDASLQPAILGSFQRLGVLAKPKDDPATACRPFDRDRMGFVVGEGAGCLILESYEHAKARGARWYAEWLGGRMLSDPSSLTQLDPHGTSLRRLLRDVAGLANRPPDYINLHGTATRPNDSVESSAVASILGSTARETSCSSLKGGLGHLLGAAGSVELAATLLAIRDQIVPPTVNLFSVDPELAAGINFTPREPQQRQIDLAWKLSLGFGGHLSAACVGRLPGDEDRTKSL